ncbi:hypothetical protein MGYG_02692 [Nannizzia gypsea CBS 118893]|uniref:Isopenicillin N synthase-like Fe(2+) 2OG dioxygenase domain-containing protein n=1 Tax=Arthroderma gypseum (strain ATCC MYA-4604 / CBS 118893) TaxID=535722 RepID=E4UNS6_ARTGP|nr:hypothetical protein MGYG_02692 [Nannizzia gypsea CBS 118893]EFQ99679.1 hypothetical protein MGYG_02692 [Nannizzia gypsea CBS 118893]
MAQATMSNVSDVTTVDLARLIARDAAEVEILLKAAASPGYFFLDFRNDPATKDIARQVQSIYQVADDYFEQPSEAKLKDLRNDIPASSDRGYKFCPTDESFEISYNEMRAGTLKLPEPLAKQAQLINEFHSSCHSSAHVLLARLAESLEIPFEKYHQESMESETGLKLIAEPSLERAVDVQENKHKDSGTLTMLFCDSWGMHFNLPGQGETWVFTPPPPPGCALIHGAKSLQRLSHDQLHAPLHRVTQPRDGAAKRYFLSYFLRPGELQDQPAAAA